LLALDLADGGWLAVVADRDKAGDAEELASSHWSSASPMSKCTDPLAPLDDFGRFTSAAERLRLRLTCEEFFLRLVDEPPPFASFFRSVCDPSFPCPFASFVRPCLEGTLVCVRPPLPCPTTCLVFFVVCVAGLVEGEFVSAAKFPVSNWYFGRDSEI